MIRTALYARVSTRDKEQNPETQLLKLRSYAQDRGWQIIREYVDHCSGKDETRPELDILMIDAHKNNFDVILCLRIDRFARSVRNLVNMLYIFEQERIRFVCAEQPIDTDSSMGRFTTQILGAAAELEAELTRERINEGLERARAEGKRLGRPPSDVSLDDLLDLLNEGLRPKEVMNKLGIGKSTFYRVMSQNPPP